MTGLPRWSTRVAAIGGYCALAGDERVRDCAALVAIGLLAAAFVRPFHDTPFVDDWAYAWSVERLLREGRLELLDYSVHLNVAQILWGWLFCIPFGFSFTALRWSTWTLAAAAICGTYPLLRRLEVGRQPARLGAGTLAVYPPFAILSATFMTDVPFVSVTVLGSYAMVSAVRARSTAWLAAAAILAVARHCHPRGRGRDAGGHVRHPAGQPRSVGPPAGTLGRGAPAAGGVRDAHVLVPLAYPARG